jgi:hypothetical protein
LRSFKLLGEIEPEELCSREHKRRRFFYTTRTVKTLIVPIRDGTGTCDRPVRPGSVPVRISDRPVYLFFPLFIVLICSKLLDLNEILYKIPKKIVVEVNYLNYHYPKIELVSGKFLDRPVTG